MKMMMIDPPEGWRYGFPREFDPKEGQSVEDWFIEKGYPESLISKGWLKWCRSWETETVK